MTKRWILASGVILATFAQTEPMTAQPAQSSSAQTAFSLMGTGGGTAQVASGQGHTMTYQGGPDGGVVTIDGSSYSVGPEAANGISLHDGQIYGANGNPITLGQPLSPEESAKLVPPLVMARGGGGSAAQGNARGYSYMANNPAQAQQALLETLREKLEVSDDAEWNAIKPRVQKVLEARAQAGMAPIKANTDNNQSFQMLSAPKSAATPEADALQNAIDSKASAANLRTTMAKLVQTRNQNAANLKTAQESLRELLDTRREAIACVLGLL